MISAAPAMHAERIGRWASLSTTGAERTDLYFRPFNPNVAYLNVQHAGSDIDRTVRISAVSTVPAPATVTLFATGLAAVVVSGGARCRMRR